MPWEAVVFDLDDTLYPEREYVQSGMIAVSVWIEQELGLPARLTLRELCRLRGTAGHGRTFDAWSEIHGLDPREWAPLMVQAYRRHPPTITLFPEALQVLRQLSSQCALGLVSDGYLEAQRRKWAALDIDRYFRAIVFSDELGRAHWKPSPLPYRTVLDRLMVPAERAVYVGDNPTKDFRGARLAGMSTIRVRRQGGLYAHLDPSSPDDAPDAEVSDVSEISRGPAWAIGIRREAGCITKYRSTRSK